jgi:uncharacterized protein (DUF433 family)
MNRIELNPEICNGRPVIRGTRIAVHTILGFLSAGDSIHDVLAGYPQLTQADILACLDYARRLSETHSVVRLAS